MVTNGECTNCYSLRGPLLATNPHHATICSIIKQLPLQTSSALGTNDFTGLLLSDDLHKMLQSESLWLLVNAWSTHSSAFQLSQTAISAISRGRQIVQSTKQEFPNAHHFFLITLPTSECRWYELCLSQSLCGVALSCETDRRDIQSLFQRPDCYRLQRHLS